MWHRTEEQENQTGWTTTNTRHVDFTPLSHVAVFSSFSVNKSTGRHRDPKCLIDHLSLSLSPPPPAHSTQTKLITNSLSRRWLGKGRKCWGQTNLETKLQPTSRQPQLCVCWWWTTKLPTAKVNELIGCHDNRTLLHILHIFFLFFSLGN